MIARAPASAVAVLAALAIAGCGGGDGGGYPSSSKQNFLTACEKNSSDAFCKCAIGRLEDKLPYDEFKKEDAAARGGKPISQKVRDIVSSCAGK